MSSEGPFPYPTSDDLYSFLFDQSADSDSAVNLRPNEELFFSNLDFEPASSPNKEKSETSQNQPRKNKRKTETEDGKAKTARQRRENSANKNEQLLKRYERFVKNTTEDRALFERLKGLLFKSQLSPEEIIEKRKLKNTFSARASRSCQHELLNSLKKKEQTLEARIKALEEENLSLKQSNEILQDTITMYQNSFLTAFQTLKQEPLIQKEQSFSLENTFVDPMKGSERASLA